MSPAGEYEIVCTPKAPESTLSRDPIWVPFFASQIRIDKSPFPPRSFPIPPPLAIFVPQGEKHTDQTESLCPLNVDAHSRVKAFQILTDLSSLQLASLDPSGLKQTPRTMPECPLNVNWHVPVDVSQILTLASQLPLATCLPSGLKQTLETSL